MSDSPGTPVPNSLDRAAVERVLARATELQAGAAPDAEGSLTEARIDAHLGGFRRLMAQQQAALTGASMVGGGILAVLSFSAMAVAAPVVLVAPLSYFVARSAHIDAASRAQLVLEQVLDRLERGDAGRPPSLISMLAAAVGGGRRTGR